MTCAPPPDTPARGGCAVDLEVLTLLRRLDRASGRQAMYEAADQTLAKLVGPDRVAIGTIEPATQKVRIEYLRGDSLGLPDQYETLPPDVRSLVRVPLTEGIPVLHTLHPERDIYRGDAMRRQHGMRQALVAPIVAQGAVIGLINLNSTADDRFSVETTTIVESIARMLGLALLAHPTAADPIPASQIIAESLGRIAMAETAEDVLGCLYRGIERATGASILRLARDGDGYRVVQARAAEGHADLELDRIGTTIAQTLAPLVDANIGLDTIPQRAIVADLPLGASPPARVHPTSALPPLPGVGAMAITPLHAAHEVLGALVAIWPEPIAAELLPAHARVVFSFSDIAGPALHRLILVDRLEQRLANAEMIRRLTDSIARTPRLQDALDIICRTSRLITGADFVGVFELAPEHALWLAASGASSTAFLHQRLPGPPGVLNSLLSHQSVVLVEDARTHPEFTPASMPIHTAENLRSTGMVPVYVNARLRASMMFAWRRPQDFDTDLKATFHAIAATASTALASFDARIRAEGT